MKKLIRHKWWKVPGWWKVWECEHCGATKKYDKVLQRIVYYTKAGNGPFYRVPECKRIMHCDKIEL